MKKPFAKLRQLLARPRNRRGNGGAPAGASREKSTKPEELLSQIENLDITSQQFIDEVTELRDACSTTPA